MLVVLLALLAYVSEATTPNRPPPHFVNSSARYARHYAAHGFVIIPGLLPQALVDDLARAADRYALSGRMVSDKRGGLTKMDVRSHARTLPLFRAVNESPRLHSVLSAILGKYRFMERNELIINRALGWHFDAMQWPMWKEGLGDEWTPSAAGDHYGLLNVALYLEDHVEDDEALTVRPASHLRTGKMKTTKGKAETSELTLHPHRGDAIIFDWKIQHRGVFQSQISTSRPRRLLSIGYGRQNAFTERIAAEMVTRNDLYNNASRLAALDCAASFVDLQSDCVRRLVAHDMETQFPELRGKLLGRVTKGGSPFGVRMTEQDR